MHIDYLADHPEFISAVARWHHEEWSYIRPGDTVEARTLRLRDECGRGQIPTTFIAYSDSTLFGTAMLIAHDMDTHMDLTPWLAGVFVVPNYRRQGIASKLIARVVGSAANLGVKRVYLFTPDAEQLYSRLGWSVIERTTYRGTDAIVMSYDVPAGSAPKPAPTAP